MENNLLHRKYYALEKFPGKGGWTYVSVPEIPPDPNAPFGWVSVSGQIDEILLEKIKLLPMGNGTLFLPVKAGLRKALNKKAGDQVSLKLYYDEGALPIPDDLEEVLADERELKAAFDQLPIAKKNDHIKRIVASKMQDTRVQRILALLKELEGEARR
ncbi:MAG: DUF1905 domain-containing protein [Saprospiraceae bacterium]|nr:DUF1905 domain-containing protein [Saprospiraceae bacterium]